MSKHNRRSGRVERFAMIPVGVLFHASVVNLDHAAFRVLMLLASEFRGHNNGALGFTATQAANAAGLAKNTFFRALKTLVKHGLIEMTFAPSRVPPRPTMFALTWRPINDTEHSRASRIATHLYRDWTPEKNNFAVATIATKGVNHCDQGGGVEAHSRNGCDHGADFDDSLVAIKLPLSYIAIGSGDPHG